MRLALPIEKKSTLNRRLARLQLLEIFEVIVETSAALQQPFHTCRDRSNLDVQGLTLFGVAYEGNLLNVKLHAMR